MPCVAATDYIRALPRMIASWIPGPFVALGTDSFGFSERREILREHFKVDANSIAEIVLKVHQKGLDDREL